MMSESGNVGSQASDILRSIAKGKRISFVSGNFNVVHPGHMRLFKFAQELGDVLVVGVNADGAPGVTLPMELRLENVSSISRVDHVVPLDVPPEKFIEALKPDFVVKGKEFENKDNPEKAAVES